MTVKRDRNQLNKFDRLKT